MQESNFGALFKTKQNGFLTLGLTVEVNGEKWNRRNQSF